MKDREMCLNVGALSWDDENWSRGTGVRSLPYKIIYILHLYLLSS